MVCLSDAFVRLGILTSAVISICLTAIPEAQKKKFCIEEEGIKKFWNKDAWEYLACTTWCKNGVEYIGCGDCCGVTTSSPVTKVFTGATSAKDDITLSELGHIVGAYIFN